MLQDIILCSFFEGLLFNVPLAVLDASDWSINRQNLRVPVKFAEIFEELAENVEWCLELVVEIVEEEYYQDVEGVCCHVSGMRTEECSIKG